MRPAPRAGLVPSAAADAMIGELLALGRAGSEHSLQRWYAGVVERYVRQHAGPDLGAFVAILEAVAACSSRDAARHALEVAIALLDHTRSLEGGADAARS